MRMLNPMNLPKDEVAVKICGITRREDALAAIDSGADLLGFNTWRGTKRFIDLAENADWIATLPVMKVALLINATTSELEHVVSLPWIDAIQLHGDEDSAYCTAAAALGKPIIKALRATSSEALEGADRFSTEHILLDAHVPGAFGGTGSRVDGDLVRRFSRQFPKLTLWLAGGLKPENVGAAVAEYGPRVVDVSSGVESEPARKDVAKMRSFIAAAKGR
jgi:phosphoribosylanthranilate isomerase